jgi:hypothetical protein
MWGEMNNPQIAQILFLLILVASDWPQFRGPTGEGVSDKQGLPLTWSETKNVHWKVPIRLAAGQQLKHVATNQLDGRTLASMAVANGSIFIRRETHLYRISN